MIPEGWKESVLGACCEVLDNMRVPLNSAERLLRKGNVPYYGANGIVDYVDEAIFSEPLVLLAEDGGHFNDFATRPICMKIDGPAWVNNHAHVLKSRAGILREWIYFWFVHRDIREYLKGGTRQKLNKSDLLQLPLLLPPLPEQRAIAKILDSVDATISATEATLAQTRRVKQALLQQLLTKGIDENGRPHTKFKMTEIGLIPEGWEAVALGSLFLSIEGGVSVNGENRPLGHQEKGVLKISAVTSGVFDETEAKAINASELARARLNPIPGCIVFSRANTANLVGASAFIDRSFPNLFLPDKLWQISVTEENSARWLGYLIRKMKDDGLFARLATGTSASMKNISKEKLVSIRIARPPKPEQLRCAESISNIESTEFSEIQCLESLKKLKKALMRDLLTGRVRVKDIKP
jgi:type I restriction enzyme S subunit